jgi:multiple sugar transport system permease protein
MNPRRRKVLRQALRYGAAIVALFFFLFPVYFVCIMAFKSGSDIYANPPIWVPTDATLRHFERVIGQGGLWSLGVSLLNAGSSTVLAVLIGSLAAYAMARYKVGGDNLPFFILSQRFMPPVAVIFPFLLFFKTLKWMDTPQALIVVYLIFNLPYAVWMMRGFFLEIPREVEESALVDGCSPLGAFWRIALPLVRPGMVATGVFCFIFSWTEFFFALTLTKSHAVPISVYVVNFFGNLGVQWGQIGAATIISITPVFILSIIVQRYLVRGLTLGAVK